MAMPWVRQWNEILDNPKIMTLPAPLYRYWSLLLNVAQRHDRSGVLPEFTHIAFALRVTEHEVSEAIENLVKARLVEKTAKAYRIHDWGHWQSHGMSDAERQRLCRQRKRDMSRDRSHDNHVPLSQMSHPRPRARSGSVSESESQEGGAGGNHAEIAPEPGPEFTALGNLAIELSADMSLGAWVSNMARLGYPAAHVRHTLEQGAAAGKWGHQWLQGILKRLAVEGLPPPPKANGPPDRGSPSPMGPGGTLPPELEAKCQAWDAENERRKASKQRQKKP